MPSQAPAVDDAALRTGLARALDTINAISGEFVNGTPDDAARAKAVQILRALGLAPPDTAQADDEEDEDVDANGLPLTPAQRAAKRERKAWNAQFKNIDKARAEKAARDTAVRWPADMSAGKHDKIVKQQLGAYAPKKGR
jgi:hypothetical protein